jgi:hypothetical protein
MEFHIVAKIVFKKILTPANYESVARGKNGSGVHVELMNWRDKFAQIIPSLARKISGSSFPHPSNYERQHWWKTRSYMWYISREMPTPAELKQLNTFMREHMRIKFGYFGEFSVIQTSSRSIVELDRAGLPAGAPAS